MDAPSNSTLSQQRPRLHSGRNQEKTGEASWFAMEAAIPTGTNRAQEECPFPLRFTEIHLPHGTIVSGPTGYLTVDGGEYRIVYPDSFKSKTSWIVVSRDENMAVPDNTSHPGASKNGTSTQPAQDVFQQSPGSLPYNTSSENNIFNHEAMVDEGSPAQFSRATYPTEDGNGGFFDEAMGAITASLTDDAMPGMLADMVEVMDADSPPERQGASEFEHHEHACQKFRNIFSAAIVPETDPEELRQAALDHEQLQNCLGFHAVNPTWPKLPSVADSWVHPQALHPQDSVGIKAMGPIDHIQKQGFLTIRLPTFYRVHSTRGTLTSFDVPFHDGTEQAGGGMYSFYLPTNPPVNYELPCLHPGVMAALNLPTYHRIWRDGEFIPNTLIKGPHQVMYVDGDIEIVDCHDSSCLLKDAGGQGEATAPLDIHDSGTDPDKNKESKDTDDQSPEDAGDKSPRDNSEQTPNDASNESEETTDGEWDYLPKHIRPPQHKRAVMAVARELLRPRRDWLYNEAKKERGKEEEEKKEEEAKEERKKKVQKEQLKRASELHRQAAYREKTRQKREADARELAAMMRQQEATSVIKTRRPQRRTARAAVDYREKVAIQSSSSADSSKEDESGSMDSSEDEAA